MLQFLHIQQYLDKLRSKTTSLILYKAVRERKHCHHSHNKHKNLQTQKNTKNSICNTLQNHTKPHFTYNRTRTLKNTTPEGQNRRNHQQNP